MNKNLSVAQAVELIRFKVAPEKVNAFIEGRKTVDAFTSTLNGYVGTELLKVNETEFMLVIRWADETSVREAQQITATATVISDWITQTAQFVSFETGVSVYEH